jgi:hypothetical protein
LRKCGVQTAQYDENKNEMTTHAIPLLVWMT